VATHAAADFDATGAAAAVSSALTTHTANTANPHAVTKAQVGLGAVDNTSDLGKPIGTATADALATKAADSAVVHLAGAETIAGAKTFSATIVGSITGNAATVTSGVYTTGSYGDPAWITSLAGSKLTGTVPATVLPVFGGSGGSHARGAVPDPGAVAGSTRFLCENGTFTSTATASFVPGVGISSYPTPGAASTTIEAGGGPIPQLLNPLALVNLVSVTDQDTSYVDLDLSPYIPPGAAVAWFYLAVQMAVADSTIKLQWRAKGDISIWGASGSDGSFLIQPMVAGYYAATVTPIRLGPDRIIQYKRVNAGAKSCIWRVWFMGWQ
jgi:hypothetical protein